MRRSIESLGEREVPGKALQVNNEDAPAVFLDPWLTAQGAALSRIVDHLIAITAPDPKSRTRSIRKDAAGRIRMTIGNIVANLAHLALSPSREPGNMLAIATAKSKPTRYDRADYPQGILAETLRALERAGMLAVTPYVFRQRTTTVEPTPIFIDMLERHGVRLSDIGRDAGGETIWLVARGGRAEETKRPRHISRKVPILYDDTEETMRMRSEVERINEVLNAAGIAYAGEPVGPIAMRRSFLLRSERDPHRFDLNGRLIGGFWQYLKSDRRYLITIGGESIADLDFVSAFAMLAYLKATGNLPARDPYAIPGLEDHRDGAKLALISLLSRTGPLKLLAPKLKAKLPEDWTAWMVAGAMTDRHLPIAHLFGADVGIELMGTESRVLMAVLLELADKGIPALPMHDGINVRASDREIAMRSCRRSPRGCWAWRCPSGKRQYGGLKHGRWQLDLLKLPLMPP